MTFFCTPSIIHQKVKKWQSFLVAGNFLAGVSGLPGRSIRPLVFPILRQLCGAVLDTPPEYHRRVPGVSGWPEYPALETGVSGLWISIDKDSVRVRSLRPPRSLRCPGPESPALPRLSNVWRGTGTLSGGSPEGDRSFQRSEIVEGYKYPSTYLRTASSSSIYEP